MNCREYTAEFEERRARLSEAARLHLDDCPGCEKTSRAQTRVWQAIDALARVDAPNDFEFHVKAKIANAKPADFQPRFLPVLRYVLPLGLIVMVLGLLTFNTSLFVGNDGESRLSQTPVQPTPAAVIPPIDSFSSNQVAVAAASGEILPANIANADMKPTQSGQQGQLATAKVSPKMRTNAPKKNVDDNFLGWKDTTVSEEKGRFPFGLDPNRTIKTLPRVENENFLSDTFQVFGIETVSESGKLKVKTVKQNSLAERSDVKVGDVIEAVNDVKLSASAPRPKKIEVKKMTIVRDGEKIAISVKN